MSALHSCAEFRPVCTIDGRDRIAFVNEAWLRFMHPGGSDAAALAEPVGGSIWDLIPAGPVRQLWEVLYRRVRAMGARLFVPMRIDTLHERRLVEIELEPLAEGSIQHLYERIWSEVRAPVALLNPGCARDERTLHCCAWCNRVEVARGVWEEIEEAERLLPARPGGTLPALSTAACTTCKQSILKTFPLDLR